MPVHESDVCIIGGGVTAAMLSQKLAALRPGISITVVEAGRTIFDLENRMHYRERTAKYGENPWPGDFIEDQSATGIISRTMAVGGLAPMALMPLTWNLKALKAWGDKSGIPFQATPQAKNTKPYDGRSQCLRCGTCDICPTGARYSPDFTFKALLAAKKIVLHDQTLVRRLIPERPVR